jgi:hypothetical protein
LFLGPIALQWLRGFGKRKVECGACDFGCPTEFVLFGKSSHSRRIFIGSHSLPPLLLPNRSFSFMHSTTHALRDVEVVELSVLVVGISQLSKPLIQSEDSIIWKLQSSTSRHKYDVPFWKRSAGTCISFCKPVQEYWESFDSGTISSWLAIVKT